MELFVIFPRRHPSSSHTHIGLNATLAAGGSSPIFDCSAPLTASVSRNYAKELKFLLQGASLLCSREPIFIFIATPGFYDEPLSPQSEAKEKEEIEEKCNFYFVQPQATQISSSADGRNHMICPACAAEPTA